MQFSYNNIDTEQCAHNTSDVVTIVASGDLNARVQL